VVEPRPKMDFMQFEVRKTTSGTPFSVFMSTGRAYQTLRGPGNLSPSPPRRACCHCRGTQVHGAHQAALHIPALYLPSRSRYSFSDPERMEAQAQGAKSNWPTVATRLPAASAGLEPTTSWSLPLDQGCPTFLTGGPSVQNSN